MDIKNTARNMISEIDQLLTQKLYDEAEFVACRAIKVAIEEERQGCVAVINEAREEGETDLRTVRAWIEARGKS